MSKKRKQKRRGKAADKHHLARQVQAAFDKHPGESFSVRQVITRMKVRDRASKELITQTIFEMQQAGELIKTRSGKFQSNLKSRQLVGKVDFTNPRFGYVAVEGLDDDIWIADRNMLNAMHGDKVGVVITKKAGRGMKQEGVVTEVIERKRNRFVGRVEIHPKYAFVIPDFRKIHVDIFVAPENLKNAKENDKVVVEIKSWHDKGQKNPVGVVTEILGKTGENEAEIHSIMAEFGLPFRFPEEVEAAAETISDEISSKEIARREDFRDIITFTIDPDDAKDFDDALSLRKLENGHYEVGVHIADVTHYVKEGATLDKEAYERATSVYLVDRTIPMLPERLSNGLCSLRPHEDKLTFSAVFELDENAKVHEEWFGRTIIHSDRRFTYEEAQERLESGEGDFAEELQTLNKLAHHLKRQRFKNGAINFETQEVKFKLDEDGKPIEIIPKVRKDAHKLIEEFMLLANKKVAEFVYNMKKGKIKNTFVYRTHDYPDPEKLNSFALFARKFGHQLDFNAGEVSGNLNHLMDDIEGKPEQNILESLAIRAMAKAKYTTDEDMHFGLAFQHYTHFTSPIRRYPDVMVHRLLYHYLQHGQSVDKEEYEERCVHSSEMEKRAADADRASIKYKQVEFMANAEDKPYAGIVSGVTEWGIFVEMTETKCEGMIRLADLDDDYYEFDEDQYRVIGRMNKRMITLGDEVVVRVKHADIDRRTIDLAFVNE